MACVGGEGTSRLDIHYSYHPLLKCKHADLLAVTGEGGGGTAQPGRHPLSAASPTGCARHWASGLPSARNTEDRGRVYGSGFQKDLKGIFHRIPSWGGVSTRGGGGWRAVDYLVNLCPSWFSPLSSASPTGCHIMYLLRGVEPTNSQALGVRVASTPARVRQGRHGLHKE